METNTNQGITTNEQFERLIDFALKDGILTDKEREVIMKKAQSLGIDVDEAELILEAKLIDLNNGENKAHNTEHNYETSTIGNYQKEYNRIKNQNFKPIQEVVFLTGRRTKYDNDDRSEYTRIETERIKNECYAFIDSISPNNEIETIDALDFLSHFLPSPSIEVLLPKKNSYYRAYKYNDDDYEYNYDRDYTVRAVSKIKTIIKESEEKFSSVASVMNKVKVVKDRLKSLSNILELKLEESKERLANSDNDFEKEKLDFKKAFRPFRIRRCVIWAIFVISFVSAWIFVDGWGWSVLINILTLGLWFLFLVIWGESLYSDYKDFKEEHKPTKGKKLDKEFLLEATIKVLCNKELPLFKL
mgnify:FL=1